MKRKKIKKLKSGNTPYAKHMRNQLDHVEKAYTFENQHFRGMDGHRERVEILERARNRLGKELTDYFYGDVS